MNALASDGTHLMFVGAGGMTVYTQELVNVLE
jgi:hypothetical protein